VNIGRATEALALQRAFVVVSPTQAILALDRLRGNLAPVSVAVMRPQQRTEGVTIRKEDLSRSEFFRMPWVEEAVRDLGDFGWNVRRK